MLNGVSVNVVCVWWYSRLYVCPCVCVVYAVSIVLYVCSGIVGCMCPCVCSVCCIYRAVCV